MKNKKKAGKAGKKINPGKGLRAKPGKGSKSKKPIHPWWLNAQGLPSRPRLP